MSAVRRPSRSRGMRVARIVLIAVGAVLTGVAVGLVAIGVPARQWTGILLWLAGALVLHDALLAPLLLVAARSLRRTRRVLPWGAIAAVEVVLVVAGLFTLLAFPAIRAQAIGARNTTVLPFDYSVHLAVVWAIAGVLIAVVVAVGTMRRRVAARPDSASRGTAGDAR